MNFNDDQQENAKGGGDDSGCCSIPTHGAPEESHYFIKLAIEAIKVYVETGKIIKPHVEEHPELKKKAGLFVSLKKNGELRGCIGTLEPTTSNIGYEIVQNAISSATKDTRFNPVTIDEVEKLTCSIDVMGEPDIIHNVSELDPSKYGIIVKCGMRQGLLLPNLHGVTTVEEQIAVAKSKAHVAPEEYVEIYKFETRRYK